jgi:hypothetical protein
MDEGWGLMNEDDDEGGFSSDEMPYVNAALSIMEKSFTTVKITMDVMSLLSEQPSVFAVDNSLHDAQVWVATVFNIDMLFSSFATELGMELYTPLSLSGLKSQYDVTYVGMVRVHEKLQQAQEMCNQSKCLSKEGEEKMTRLLHGFEELLADIELEKMCFVDI